MFCYIMEIMVKKQQKQVLGLRRWCNLYLLFLRRVSVGIPKFRKSNRLTMQCLHGVKSYLTSRFKFPVSGKFSAPKWNDFAAQVAVKCALRDGSSRGRLLTFEKQKLPATRDVFEIIRVLVWFYFTISRLDLPVALKWCVFIKYTLCEDADYERQNDITRVPRS